MFDIGWTELLVIACVAIIVVGPKDLPRMLRTLGQTMGKMRRMSREFQSTFNDALREAESQADIADMKKQVEKAANFNPLGDIKKSIEEDAAKRPDKPKAAAAKPVSEDQPLPASGEPAGEKPSSEPAAVTKAKPVKKAVTKAKPVKKPVTEDVKA
ncbi:Sec-independent protein translocase protein TatB [Roseibium marinum]|uniref:Sec-independent protein translocase protein TatB n=1 Tax=Roseibium marinum TaxID=281252 RepID=A0A2S3UNY3_9HYPH|nr:Sec-independent protein translocase protein TatB [Roseibium marinum]POF29384.1 sec-independent protein translocase protein TatB [Roseibium marinum]